MDALGTPTFLLLNLTLSLGSNNEGEGFNDNDKGLKLVLNRRGLNLERVGKNQTNPH